MKGFVYTITNIINDKKYIGSTYNPDQRWKTHQYELRCGTHHNIYLQRAVNKYGLDNFRFDILIESETYKEIEEAMINETFDTNYNVSKQSSGGDLISYHPNRDAIREKISKATKKRYESKEERMKCSLPGEKNGRWENGVSVKHCECGNIIGYGVKQCAACRDRTGVNNPFYGKSHSPEALEKIRKARIGNVPPNAMRISIDGIEYPSHAEAARQLGVSAGTITHRLNSPNPKYKNYIRISS